MRTNHTIPLYVLERIPSNDSNRLNVSVQIDRDHRVFDGHFPDFPILPGVYLIQMVKDSLNTFLPDNYQMKAASWVKYLKPVEPGKENKLRLEIILTQAEESLLVSANTFLKDETINFKFKGEFVKS